MSNLYDWSAAPEWANFGATDADGFQCWYEYEPALRRGGDWREYKGRAAAMDVEPPTNFKDSLERRS